MMHLVKNICLRNFDSVSKDHILGMYVYVMEAYTIQMSILFLDFLQFLFPFDKLYEFYVG